MSDPTRASDRHPSWDQLRPFVEAPTPSSHVIDGQPRITLNSLGSSTGLELLTPFDGDVHAIAPLAEIDIDAVEIGGERQLRLRASDAKRLPLFYELCLTIADLAQCDSLPIDTAVARAVTIRREFLRGATLLSPERQTGLYGELIILRRLEARSGAAALDSWTGPTAQAHDFRLGDLELEVKTTRGERRSHLINGASQLEPSPSAQLMIASIQLTAAGTGGESLAQLISDLRARFTASGAGERFSQLIAVGCHVPLESEPHYRDPLKLRTDIVLVPVDASLPRITAEDVSKLSRPEMSRISDVSYRLDLDGLGMEDGSAEFLEILPTS